MGGDKQQKGLTKRPPDEFFEEMREALEEHTQNKDTELDRFVTFKDQQEVWDSQRLFEFMKICKLKLQKGQDYLKTNHLLTMSTLVSIGWQDWSKFVDLFITHIGANAYHDHLDKAIADYTYDLLKQEDFLGKAAVSRKFLTERWVFMPIVIEEGKSLAFKPEYRLPFIQDKKNVVGSGSYGQVTKEVIAVHQYKNKDGNFNHTTPKIVARKRFEVQEDFAAEHHVLELLRGSLTSNKRIATFLATITIGTEFNILSELAPMNLEQLLENVPKDFQFTLYNAIIEVTNLAHAIRHIHHEIRVSLQPGQGETHVSCCHLDLKPENILVYPGKPIGQWKITDFGISTATEASIRWRHDEPTQHSMTGTSRLQLPHTIADLKGKLTFKTSAAEVPVARGTGTWQAPEVNWSANTIDGQKCDIWSYGCIFIQVICRALYGAQKFEEFNNRRRLDDDGHDAADDTFYRKYGSEYKLNPHVNKWIQGLLGHDTSQIIDTENAQLCLQNCREIMLLALKISPKDRIDAKTLYASLGSIFREPIRKILRPQIHQERPEPRLSVNEHLSIIDSPTAIAPTPTAIHVNAQHLHSFTEAPQTPSFSITTPEESNLVAAKGKTRADLPLGRVDVVQDQAANLTASESSLEPDSDSTVEDPVVDDNTGLQQSPTTLASDRLNIGKRRETAPARSAANTLPSSNEDKNPVDQNPGISHIRSSTLDIASGSQSGISSFSLPIRASRPSAEFGHVQRFGGSISNVSISRFLESDRSPRASQDGGSVLDFNPNRLVSMHNNAGLNLERRSHIMTFDLPDRGRAVTQTVISAQCRRIAFVMPKAIYIYLLTNQLSECVIRPPRSTMTWLSVSLTEKCLLTRALEGKDTIFSLYDLYVIGNGLDSRLMHTRKGDFEPEKTTIDAALSKDKFVLSQFPRYATLKDLKRNMDAIKLPVLGATKKIWFNTDGSLAFVWSAEGRLHFIDAWSVENSSKHWHHRYRVLDDEAFAKPIEDIISFPTDAKCLMWKSSGHVCILPLLEHEASRGLEPTPHGENWKLYPLQAVSVGLSNDTTIYIRRGSRGQLTSFVRPSTSKIFKGIINFKGDQELMNISDTPKGIELKIPLPDREWMFVIGVSQSIDIGAGSLQVFIAHFSGHVEVITMPG